jgi:anti-anti-sigma factor
MASVEVRPLADGIIRINVTGRMDIAGAEEVDLQFTGIVSAVTRGAVVDLSGVTFLSSIGIRTLIANAKTLKRRGASMALFGPSPLVTEVLRSVGVTDVIPLFHDLDEAVFVVKSGGRFDA